MSRPRSKLAPRPADKSKPRHQCDILIQGIPKSTRNAFKAACAENEETMRDAFITFMRDYARRTEEEIKAV